MLGEQLYEKTRILYGKTGQASVLKNNPVLMPFRPPWFCTQTISDRGLLMEPIYMSSSDRIRLVLSKKDRCAALPSPR